MHTPYFSLTQTTYIVIIHFFFSFFFFPERSKACPDMYKGKRVNQRVGRLSRPMWGWRRRAIYSILKQNPYNFTTKALKAYLSAQAPSLNAFVICKTLIGDQKPRGRQLNAKVCGHESAIFRILSFFLVKSVKICLQGTLLSRIILGRLACCSSLYALA